MQSRVEALGVLCNHSINILSSSSPSIGPGGSGFRFLGFGGAVPLLAAAEEAVPLSSGALRLFVDGVPLTPLLTPATGLVARLPEGLAARLDVPGGPLNGLFPRLTLGLGAFGLVARFATTEWPPIPEVGAGETARDATSDPFAALPTVGLGEGCCEAGRLLACFGCG